jgi:cyclic AMP-responsive element-binding protein 3
LELSEEEKRICEREGIKLPSHYPLSREEERNLKKIRRKIRNKLSAQDSRKRKKEYMDNMEDRVRACSDENEDLHKRIEQLETQNKTLAGQLKRLHQIILSGGFTTRANQTSTAMMVLLLSTALFLIPGLRENRETQKSEIDITRAIKMPPMPGQSRSLLQFNPNIKEEFNVNDNTVDQKVPALDNINQEITMNGE